MSLRQLRSIEKIFDLKFKKKQGAFIAVVQQENQLRSQLSKLETQFRESQIDGDQRMQAIGADVIWHSWVERSKKSLNMELAQVLAQKEKLLSNVKKDYGKLLISRELSSSMEKAESERMQSKLLATATELSALKRGL